MSKSAINLRYLSAQLILDSKENDKQISESINLFFNKENLKSLDRNIITDLVNGPIRYSLKLKDIFINNLNGDLKTLNKLYVEIIKIAIYEIFYTKKPNYAVVNLTVDLVKSKFPKYTALTNGVLRNIVRGTEKVKPILLDTSQSISVEYSYPKWLIDKWSKTFNKNDLLNLLNWNNSIPKVWFRIRDNNISNNLNKIFKEYDLEVDYCTGFNDFFTVNKPSLLINNSLFKDGRITIQSPVSSLVVDLMNVKAGHNIYDVCSSPGGKSSLILDNMNCDNILKAFDINNIRESKLRDTLNRLNLNNFTFTIADATKCKFDNIDIALCDVPCSGTGTIGKKSDLRWRVKMNNIIEHSKKQSAIINNISKYINKNGALIYSTCSIEKEENWEVVNSFLDSHSNFMIEDASKYVDKKYVDSKGAINILPHIHGIEGGFAVRLVKYA